MARFVKLDLDQWEPPETPANPAKVANLPVDHGNEQQRLAGLATLADLPADIRAGVERLKVMHPPHLVAPDAWPIAVSDASYLAESGWAAKALALEWSSIQLFGCVTDATGDTHSDGLAVWLNGRKLVAITATSATVEDGGNRYFYNRREQVGATLIWEAGQ